MTRFMSVLVVATAWVVAGAASRASAQPPAGQSLYADVLPVLQGSGSAVGGPMAPPAGSGAPGVTPNFDTWPRPAETPPSLFRQAASPMPYECAPIPGKYFEKDPMVDPPAWPWPQPGWVADVEISAIVPHIYQSLSNGQEVGGNAPGSFRVPITPFDWTVSPRLEFGYRLPEGFGAFMLSWQYIGTTGSGETPYGPNGPASQWGRFNMNISDFDYVSREFSPWEHWGIQWRFGFRQVYLFYDTALASPLSSAAAGNGALIQSGANGYNGWGGHVGVQVDRDFNRYIPGLSLVAKIDFGDTTGSLQQRVTQSTVGGGYYAGQIQNGQEVPSLACEIGLSYKPPGSNFEAFVGGFYQYWWNVGTLANYALTSTGTPRSGGELSLTGLTFRLSYNY